MTINHPKIIGVNLFQIIESLHHNKEDSMYLKELRQILNRESKNVKVDVMYLSSLEYVTTNFVADTVNQRVVVLTQKAMSVMDRTIPPKDYEEFIKMFANPEKDFGDAVISDKESKIKKAFGFFKS
jgi:secreted Zn-dependent insulinase-like peptidase